MKRLYLMRHAKSDWQEPTLSDIDRKLTVRGKKNAKSMGERLAKFGCNPSYILSSPALRARSTARRVIKRLGFTKEAIIIQPKIYDASCEQLLTVIKKIPDEHREVLIFGHNPGMTEIVNILSKKPIDNMPTSGVYVLDFDVASWLDVSSENSQFVMFDSPRSDD